MTASHRKKKISIQDVARRAQVSISTVSRVINKLPTVDKENVVKVEEAVKFLKYKPNVTAQNLARGSANAIGLVMPGYPGIFHSYYAIEIIRGVGHACEMAHIDMMFHITDGSNPLNTSSVKGLIFADVIENQKQIEEAISEEKPCVILNNVKDALGVSYVAMDNLYGGFAATDYLINLGHKRIVTITGNMHVQSAQQRLKGYKKALIDHGIPVDEKLIFQGDYSRFSARRAAEQFLTWDQRPTAVFVMSDDMALEVINYAMELGLKIPEDLSVMGFDDNPSGMYGSVGLTTMRQPLFKMATDAVNALNEYVSGKRSEPAKIMMKPELVVRESCAQIR